MKCIKLFLFFIFLCQPAYANVYFGGLTSNDVNIVEGKNTEKTASKDMKGKAELKVSAKNEYVQIAYAVKAAKESKDNLQKLESSRGQGLIRAFSSAGKSRRVSFICLIFETDT